MLAIWILYFIYILYYWFLRLCYISFIREEPAPTRDLFLVPMTDQTTKESMKYVIPDPDIQHQQKSRLADYYYQEHWPVSGVRDIESWRA